MESEMEYLPFEDKSDFKLEALLEALLRTTTDWVGEEVEEDVIEF